uniref:ethanolamine kinase 1-like isoform X2 n=1 Tax=Myxine glutinosa TaxID=7769 RepID=UPI00358E21DA
METFIHLASSTNVPRLPVFVDENDLETGALSLLKSVRPYWKQQDVRLKMFTDGITNKLVGCSVDDDPCDVVLIRIYGNKTELFVDRDAELRSFQLLQAHGCAPRLYTTFVNGLCYEFVPGGVLDTHLVRQPHICRLTTQELARVHAIHAHNGCVPTPLIWMKLRKYLSLIPTSLTHPDTNARFEREIPSRAELQREMDELHEHLSGLGSPIVLCHNDLLVKNVIFNEDIDELKFIDYEYSGYNYQAYDIGNHFNEFAGVSDVDYSLYPSKEFQLGWLHTYLVAYHGFIGRTDGPPSARDVEKLYVQVSKFSLVSNFFWGLWALIQAKFSNIEFDFLGYAIIRLNQYRNTKAAYMALELPA